jgi:hypothetical protein
VGLVAAAETFANQPSTTVSSGGTTAPSPGATETWTVASSATFPGASTGITQFHVADTASGKTGEIILVTNVSGTTWSVTRGAESTTPVAHTAGFTVVQVVTAGFLGTLGAGSGTVTSVTATDTSIVVSGTPTAAPTIATGTLDVIAAQHPPAANWSNNSHKITSLANGSGAQDAAAFGQIPTALPPNGAASGDLAGSYPSPTVTATHLASALPVAQGGTGQATQQTAMDALAGATTSGNYLRGNGSHVTMAAIQAGDVPTLNQDTTGKSAKTDALNSATTVVNVSAATAPSTGQVLTATDSTHATWQAASGGSGVTPTAVKTTTYNAAAGDFVPCDTTSAGFTVTLPTAPADKSQVAVKMVIQASTNVVTVACGGSDVFNKSGGPTTGTLSLVNQGLLVQYKASGAIWYVVSDDLPLGQLDLRYSKLSGATFTGAVVMTPVVLTDASTVAVNAALGNQFKVTLGGNRTLGAPSNPVDGQIITVWFIQDGSGSRTITLALSPGTSGGYWYGTDLTSITLSTAAGTMDKATFQYDATNTRWDVTGFLRGF